MRLREVALDQGMPVRLDEGQSAVAALDRLIAALGAGAVENAFAEFQALLSGRSEDPAFLAWVQRGWSSFAEPDPAERWREALVQARADRTGALLLFGRAAHGAGYGAPGLAAARQAHRTAPEQAEPAFLLCAMLVKDGNAEAHQRLQDCLARFPQPSQGWADLGDVLLGLGKKPAALVCFARGAPSFALAMRRGLVARELGHRTEARAAFERAVALNPTVPRAWFLLGTCAQDAHDLEAAAGAYAAVLALDPTVAEAALNLGTVRQDKGDLAGAKDAYRQAVRLRPDTFGRAAQALTTSSKGELWLDLGQLRRHLAD